MTACLIAAYILIVGQSLAFGPFDRFDNPFAIIEFARVPAKSEFVTIPVKVFLAYGMKRSQQTTLDQREEGFGTVHAGGGAIRIALSVFLLGMVHNVMPSPEMLGNRIKDGVINPALIGINDGAISMLLVFGR